jgi:integrase
MPSLTVPDMNLLIESASAIRDKAIISTFADTGLRLAELARIEIDDIDWQNRIIKVTIKGNRQSYAVFGERTKLLLEQWLSEHRNHDGLLWDVNESGITWMLRKLERATGIKCNAHCFRRGFASELARRGVNEISIMRLGRWQSLAMVQLYTQSVVFQDALKFYEPIIN